MTTLSSLSATPVTAAAPLPQAKAVLHVTQSKRKTAAQSKFWRTADFGNGVITMRSSLGGMVQIPISELWKLGEAHDANLQIPVAAKAP